MCVYICMNYIESDTYISCFSKVFLVTVRCEMIPLVYSLKDTYLYIFIFISIDISICIHIRIYVHNFAIFNHITNSVKESPYEKKLQSHCNLILIFILTIIFRV
jgi:hypothetical protein